MKGGEESVFLELLVPGHRGVQKKERVMSPSVYLPPLWLGTCRLCEVALHLSTCLSCGWIKSLLIDTESYAQGRPGHFPAVFLGAELTWEILKHAPLESKLLFMPAEARSRWKLPTDIAKNNYRQIESTVNSPHG